MTPAEKLVPLRKISAVSHDTHGRLRWRGATSFDFVRGQISVPLALSEVSSAAAFFPVLFWKDDTGIGPVALLSLSANTSSPFLTTDGKLRSGYTPILLRAHPFCLQVTQAGEAVLSADPSDGCVGTDANWHPFFDPPGTISAQTAPVVQMLTEWIQDHSRARNAAHALMTSGLLQPVEGDLDTGWSGYKSDLSALSILPDKERLHLLDCGAIRLAYAQEGSMAQMVKLTSPQAPPQLPAAGRDMDGQQMLQAVAKASDEERAFHDLF